MPRCTSCRTRSRRPSRCISPSRYFFHYFIIPLIIFVYCYYCYILNLLSATRIDYMQNDVRPAATLVPPTPPTLFLFPLSHSSPLAPLLLPSTRVASGSTRSCSPPSPPPSAPRSRSGRSKYVYIYIHNIYSKNVEISNRSSKTQVRPINIGSQTLEISSRSVVFLAS